MQLELIGDPIVTIVINGPGIARLSTKFAENVAANYEGRADGFGRHDQVATLRLERLLGQPRR